MTLEEQMKFVKEKYTSLMVDANKPGASLEEQITKRKEADAYFCVSQSLKRLENIRVMTSEL